MASTPLAAAVGSVRLAATPAKVPVELVVVRLLVDSVTVVTTVRVKTRVRTVVVVSVSVKDWVEIRVTERVDMTDSVDVKYSVDVRDSVEVTDWVKVMGGEDDVCATLFVVGPPIVLIAP
jgi:trans-2-enoyl-CoA reductase